MRPGLPHKRRVDSASAVNGVKGLAVWRASLALGPSLAATPGGSSPVSRALCLGAGPPERGVEASHLQKQLECRETVGRLGELESGVRPFREGDAASA